MQAKEIKNMRFHFPTQTEQTEKAGWMTPAAVAYAALAECQAAGTIASHVSFKVLTAHARRGPGSALEIQLEAATRDRGRRSGNSGSYGAMQDGSYAATYDEWGFLMAAMFRRAPDMLIGPKKYAEDEEQFHHRTGHTYDASYPGHVEKYGDEYPYRIGRNQKGRRGAGRVHCDAPQVRYAAEDERAADWLRAFQSGKVI
jgi:hypothetical protein